VDAALVAAHVLAASIWVGGTVALVFVGVPIVRGLEGETRARALKELGRRWRPIGYGALGVLVVTGMVLARDELDGASTAFRVVLAIKAGAVALMIGASVVHDFVLGPRLAAQIRAGAPPTVRPRLVWLGRSAFLLTLAVPVLGVALQQLAE
jgi:putative copper export protein